MQKINVDKTSLIGIHGPLESGKDTVAKTIMQLFPGKYRQYAFAWPIKEASKIIFGFTDEDVNNRLLKERTHPFWGITPRWALQSLGTDWGRNLIRKDIWILRAQEEIKKNADEGFGTIISDVRFDNEADVIRSRNGSLICIRRPTLDTSLDRYNHASEGGINNIYEDVVIHNNGTLQQFKQKITEVFEK
jgi:hypothetical protein